MKKTIFDEEELMIISIFEPEDRNVTITKLETLLPEVEEDPYMEDLIISTVEKLKQITDESFDALDLPDYRKTSGEDEDASYDSINVGIDVPDAAYNSINVGIAAPD